MYAFTPHTVFLTLGGRPNSTVCCFRPAVLQQNTLMWNWEQHTVSYHDSSSFSFPCLLLDCTAAFIFSIMTPVTFSNNWKFVQYVLVLSCMGQSVKRLLRTCAHRWPTLSHETAAAAAAAAWRHGIVSSEASVNRLTGPLCCSCSCWLTLYITSEGESQDGAERTQDAHKVVSSHPFCPPPPSASPPPLLPRLSSRG